jgi:hypothetical protein
VNTKLLLVDPPPVELLPDIVLARIHKGRKVGVAFHLAMVANYGSMP